MTVAFMGRTLVMEAGVRTSSTVGYGEVAASMGSASGAPTVSAELLAYIGLVIFALVLRVSALDSVPLTDHEARQSLHAWHTSQRRRARQFCNRTKSVDLPEPAM